MAKNRRSTRVALACERLSHLCLLRKWTAEELAKGAGFGVRTAQECLNTTDHHLNTETYAKLLKFLGVADPRQFDLAHSTDWLDLAVLFPDLIAARVSAGNLPVPADPNLFVGRDEPGGPMDQLRNAWEKGATLVQVVASGGIGKSTLAYHFREQLRANGYLNCRSVIDWSFYSQGQHDYQTDSTKFLHYALDHFAAFEPALDGKRGQSLEKIAAAIARIYCRPDVGGLMILDGVEPLQYPPSISGGRLKDRGLLTLLHAIMAHPCHPGRNRLIVITTRWADGNLTPSADGRICRLDLKALTPSQGADLLRRVRLKDDNSRAFLRHRSHLGTQKVQQAFENASREYGGHALALVLLGTFLLVFRDGYIDDRPRTDAFPDDVEQTDESRHARRILRDYARLLADPSTPRGRPCLQFLYLLGLWDRPAPVRMLKQLIRQTHAIEGVTDALSTDQLLPVREELARLRFVGDANNSSEIDTHPIIRDYFAKLLREERPEVWSHLQELIFHAILDDPAINHQPQTPAEMEPLFHAVIHGCKAGLHEEALERILIPRLLRGSENYAASVGGVDSLIAALSHFFIPNDWGIPIRCGVNYLGGLSLEGEMKVLALAGLYLSSTTGYASRETRQVYCGSRVEELMDSGPTTYAHVHFLYGRWRVDLGLGVLPETLASAARLRDAVTRNMAGNAEAQAGFFVRDEASARAVVHRALAVTLMWMGQFADAEIEARLGTSQPISSREQLNWLFTEPSIICQGVLAINLLHLGQNHEAIEQAAICVERALALGHHHTTAVALYMQSLAHFLIGDSERVSAIADDLIQMTTQHHFPFWRGSGLVFLGWARGQGRNAGDAIKQIEMGIDLWRSTGAKINDPIWVGIKASLVAHTSPVDAHSLYTFAIRDARERSETWCLPQLLVSLAHLEQRLGMDSWHNRLAEAYKLANQQKSLLITSQIETDEL